MGLYTLLTDAFGPRRQRSSTPLASTPDATHCVVFRKGTTSHFAWHRSIPLSYANAIRSATCLAERGIPCSVEGYAQSVAIGLPTAFAPDFPMVKEWH